MFTIDLQIPAKALLFGEYGVLSNGKALVFILPHLFFEIQIDIAAISSSDSMMSFRDSIAGSTPAQIIIRSDFFEHGKQEFSLETKNESHFFFQLLLPWAEYLKNYNLEITIKKSFPPDFGFGSSSAIIAAITYALFVFLNGKAPHIEDEFLWQKIRASLHNIQGMASGYDVGVQLAYVIEKRQNLHTYASNETYFETNKLFWIYQNQTMSTVPKICTFDLKSKQKMSTDSMNEKTMDNDLISKLGCFIKTNIYSDTTKALKKFSDFDTNEKKFFSFAHAQIAELFLRFPDFSTLQTCMSESLSLAKKQGISIHSPVLEKLEKYHLSFKTMGSGYGDCVWVAASKERLCNLGVVEADDVVFDFSDIVN